LSCATFVQPACQRHWLARRMPVQGRKRWWLWMLPPAHWGIVEATQHSRSQSVDEQIQTGTVELLADG
jgi:hypothetical protein